MSKYKNFISPVNHPESYLSGSAIESMIDRAEKLELPYFAATDHGYFTSIIKGYTYTKNKKIKFIAGVELFFKDKNCPIIKGTPSEDIKYFKIVVHAKDQPAYQNLVKMSSDAGRDKIQVGDNYYPSFNWSDLEKIAKTNVTVCTSNVECMVSKHLLVDRADLALKYYKKLLSLFGNDFYPTIIPYKHDKYWRAIAEISLGKSEHKAHIPLTDRIEFEEFKDNKDPNKARWDNVNTISTPSKLIRFNKTKKRITHVFLDKVRHKVKPDFQAVNSVNIINHFQDLPGGDIQAKANNFIIKITEKFGNSKNLLINSYSYFANEGDKVVQDMKLGEEKRIYQAQYMATTEDVVGYLKESLGLNEDEILNIVNNSYAFAEKFKDFELKYDYRLPKPEGDTKQLLIEQIKKVRRMKWDDPQWVAQFREELALLTQNEVMDFIPYFLPIVDVYDYYDEMGYLTGPARGSAGGFLISYLIGITHIDPIKYGLYSSRFITMDRIRAGNLPDIDCDLESRVPLVGKGGNSGYLFKKYGNKAAQISTRTLLRIKSAILDANRFVNGGKLEEEVQKLSKSLPNTPQGVNDYEYVFGYEKDEAHVPGLLEQNEDLQKYAAARPEEWNIVTRALSLARQNSRHACFASQTLVETSHGMVPICEQPTNANDKAIKVWSNGIQDTIVISMNNGVSIRCTPDHKFLSNGIWIEAKDLIYKPVDYRIPQHTSSNATSMDEDEAFALGWFLNDGNYVKSAKRFEFYFTPHKDLEALDIVRNWLNRMGIELKPASKRHDTYVCYNLHTLFEIEENTPIKRLPRIFWNLDEKSQNAFMRGLFSANGYCLNTRPFIGIKLTSKLLLSDIALWLNSKGIHTSCAYNKPRKIQHHNGTYISKSTGILSIPHVTNKIKFSQRVGFVQTYKQYRLDEIINSAINTQYYPKQTTCIAIENNDPTEVWDFNEPKENMAHINGVLAHNCAFIVSNTPIEDTVPIMEVGGVKRVTQPEHKQCEWAGLIKYDFLVVSQLRDINLALKYINKKNDDKNLKTGYFNHNNKLTYIWDLPEEPEVFKMLSEGKTETVFQLHSATATSIVKDVKPTSVMDCAVITSLGRPGPLDFKDEKTGRNMAEEYAWRKRGASKSDIPILQEMLPETFGVLVFQEQITKLAKELAGMGVEDSENVRIAVGKKKKKLIDSLKPIFVEGAAKKCGEETANIIWDMMETFARYGFNKSHAVAYSVISYACAYLKYYYPLEWWAAILSNADDKEINEEFYKYVKDMVLPPDINKSTEEITIDHDNGKILQKLSIISGFGEVAASNVISMRPYSSVEDFVRKKPCGPVMAKKLIHVGVLDSLFAKDDTLLNKITKYETAVVQVEFEDKIQKYKEKIENETDEKKKIQIQNRLETYIKKGPKEPDISSFYLNITPKVDYLTKKSIYPTMNINLETVLKQDYQIPILINKGKRTIQNKYGRGTMLVTSETLEIIDKAILEQDAYFVVPGYVMEMTERPFGHGKKMLKIVIDSSGYISEKIIWPDYNSGQLNYPTELKKGSIAYFFYSKKAMNTNTKIFDVVVEEASILS